MLHENDSLNMKSNYTFAGNTPRMETERLLLREVRQNDVRDIFDCWMNDEDVSRYMYCTNWALLILMKYLMNVAAEIS